MSIYTPKKPKKELPWVEARRWKRIMERAEQQNEERVSAAIEAYHNGVRRRLLATLPAAGAFH